MSITNLANVRQAKLTGLFKSAMVRSALIYMLGITIAEILTVNVNVVTGMSAYIALFISLMVQGALNQEETPHRFYVSMTLVPLIRIVSLAMPLSNMPQVWWYPIVYAPLAVATWFVTRMLGYKWSEIGFQVKLLSTQLLITFSGFAFGVVEYFILRREAELTSPLMTGTWILSAYVLLSTTGFVEELIFRGLLQRTADKALGWFGLIYTSLLFAIVHWIHRSLLDIFFVFVVAWFFAWMVKRTGSLLGVTLAHGIANIVLFLIAPLLF